MFKFLFSVFLSFLIISVQIGFVQNIHLCGGIPVISELNLSKKTLSCNPANTTASSTVNTCKKENHLISKKPCCNNSSLHLSIKEKFKHKPTYHFSFFYNSIIELVKIYNPQFLLKTNYTFHKSYYYIKDIPIWNQSFII